MYTSMSTYATKEFLEQYKKVQLLVDEVLPLPDKDEKIDIEIENLEEIFDRYQGYTVNDGGLDKRELRANKKLMSLLLTYLPNVYDESDTPLYGGRRKLGRRTRNKKNKSTKSRKIRRSKATKRKIQKKNRTIRRKNTK